jgi:hypothetical protein
MEPGSCLQCSKYLAINKNNEALLEASREDGLEVNTMKIKRMLVSRHKNVGQNQSLMSPNKSFESVAKLKYLWASVRNQSSIREKIKSRLDSENACYHSIQSLLSKNLKIRIYETTMTNFLPSLLYEILFG